MVLIVMEVVVYLGIILLIMVIMAIIHIFHQEGMVGEIMMDKTNGMIRTNIMEDTTEAAIIQIGTTITVGTDIEDLIIHKEVKEEDIIIHKQMSEDVVMTMVIPMVLLSATLVLTTFLG